VISQLVIFVISRLVISRLMIGGQSARRLQRRALGIGTRRNSGAVGTGEVPSSERGTFGSLFGRAAGLSAVATIAVAVTVGLGLGRRLGGGVIVAGDQLLGSTISDGSGGFIVVVAVVVEVVDFSGWGAIFRQDMGVEVVTKVVVVMGTVVSTFERGVWKGCASGGSRHWWDGCDSPSIEALKITFNQVHREGHY
jgi:hypothetical protein